MKLCVAEELSPRGCASRFLAGRYNFFFSSKLSLAECLKIVSKNGSPRSQLRKTLRFFFDIFSSLVEILLKTVLVLSELSERARTHSVK